MKRSPVIHTRDFQPGKDVAPAVASPRLFDTIPVPDLEMVVQWLLSRLWWIAAAALAGALLCIAYGFLAKPRYMVYTDLLIPPANLQVLPNDIYAPSLQSESQLLDVETKLLMLTAGSVMERTVRNLDLANVPEFNGTEGGSILGIGAQPGNRELTATRTLSERVKAQRRDRSYMVSVGVWARTPTMAVELARGLTDAFQAELAADETGLAGKAASTLGGRLEDLKKDAAQAEEKVARFRQENGLQVSAGELVNAQSMAQINGKLVDARSRLAEVQSRHRQLMAEKSNGANFSGTIQSPALNEMRAQYSRLSQQVESMSMTYGARFPALMTAKSQLALLAQHMSAEIEQMVQAARIEMDQAAAVVRDLEAQVTKARGTVAHDNDAQVRLRELERDAAIKTSLYETVLKRAGETGEREQVNVTNIRVVTAPSPPERKSWPPGKLLLAAAGAGGGSAVGLCLALIAGFLGAWRNKRDRLQDPAR